MNSPRRVQFGGFDADLATGELQKQGHRVRVQQQPFLVLAMLLERAGEVVSREELQKAVWPADTFVDFEYGLNTAIKKIRLALGDSADTPRFVETLPRKGYRFIAPVRWEKPAQTESSASDHTVPAHPRRLLVWVLAGLVLAGVGTAVTFWPHRSGNPGLAHVPVPLTSLPGQEQQPSFSPDARHIAFVWDGGNGKDLAIYTQPLGGSNPLRITRDPAMDVSPVWSPDGGRIAFVRIWDESNAGVFVVPSAGGPEVQVTTLHVRAGMARSRHLLPSCLAWTPDGDGLVVADMDEAASRGSLFLAPLGGGLRRRLTTPDSGWIDSAPAFSPDRRSLAFVRTLSILDSDVFVLPLNAGFIPSHEPRRVSSLHRLTQGLAWTRDGREIVFAAGPLGASRLWRVSVAGGSDPRPLAFAPENTVSPTISSQGQLAYGISPSDSNVWRMPLNAPGQPQRWIASTRDDSDAQYSPNGQSILFLSNRSGSNEIWIANADGSNAWKLTDLHTSAVGWPHWSPDGSNIVFDSNRGGSFDVFVIGAAGGQLRKLTDGKVPCGAANYSSDGSWIYYHCIEAGARQMWRMPAQGGPPKRIVPGFAQIESPDRSLYFQRFTREGVRPLFHMPVDAEDGTEILPNVEPFNYAVTPGGIYFSTPRDDSGRCFIRFLHLASGKVSTVGTYIGRPAPGISVSPDGKWLLYSYDEQRSADLMLVEDFR